MMGSSGQGRGFEQICRAGGGGWERPRGEVQERVLLCLAEQLELWAAGGAGGLGGEVASRGPRFSRS